MKRRPEIVLESVIVDEEVEARNLRDRVYGSPVSDESWSHIKQHWVKDLDWLRKEAE